MTVQAQARQIIEDATAQTKQKIATLQAKSRRETLAYQQSVKDELTEQKSDIAVREQRRQQREQLLNQMAVRLDDQTSLLDERSQTNHQQRQKIHDLRDQATALRDKRVTTLAEQAAMSTKEAEEVVLQDTDLALKRDRDIEVKALNDDAEGQRGEVGQGRGLSGDREWAARPAQGTPRAHGYRAQRRGPQ
jgi:Domain of unknown function (DUF3552).